MNFIKLARRNLKLEYFYKKGLKAFKILVGRHTRLWVGH